MTTQLSCNHIILDPIQTLFRTSGENEKRFPEKLYKWRKNNNQNKLGSFIYFLHFSTNEVQGGEAWQKKRGYINTCHLALGFNIFDHIYKQLINCTKKERLNKYKVVSLDSIYDCIRPCSVHPKKPKSFQDSSSHRILRHMHGALIQTKTKTNCTVCV